jgi:HAE1 family hydrophobic/amphiphilic exporter-1
LRSNPDGEILRLKDVANIEFGSSMYDIYSNLNGKPSAAIVLKQSFGSNANQVIEDVKAKLETLKKFPKGMDYEIFMMNFDASIEKVIHTLIEAFILVGLVVSFLGRLSTIILRLLPVSLVELLFFMLFDISLNLITLFALLAIESSMMLL